jgi:hypothetical protein
MIDNCVLITGRADAFPDLTTPEIKDGYVAIYFRQGEPIAIGWGITLREAQAMADEILSGVDLA